MIRIEIPGFTYLALEHLVLPFDGVVALDDEPQSAVFERLVRLARAIKIHILVVSDDQAACVVASRISAQIEHLPLHNQSLRKRELVRRLGMDHTMVIGQGRSDALMLEAAALGIAVQSRNGLSREAAAHADIIVRHAVDALGLLLWPGRVVDVLMGPQREMRRHAPQ